MPTIQQLVRKGRESKAEKSKSPALNSSPEKRGVCTRVYTTTPKKPNSARRKAIRVKLSTGKTIACHIPGIGHTLNKHSVVLIRGGRCQDLVGVKYKPIRGKFDFKPVEGRITRKTKYGIK